MSNHPEEFRRLQAVDRYLDFHHNRKPDLQDIVMLASYICHAPIALITLMQEDVQLVKIHHGLDESITEMPRSTSFCTHAIETEEIMVVPDALQDHRFAALPVVAGDPNIRFYASANLKSYDGYNVGTLCVYDVEPRALDAMQMQALAALANQVSNLMELDRSLKSLQRHVDEIQMQRFDIEEAKLKLRAVLDSSTTYHILLDSKLHVLAYNKGVKEFTYRALNKNIVEGDPISAYFEPAILHKFHPNFKKALSGETVKVERLVPFGSLEPLWWELIFTPARNSFGDIIGVSFHALNINERKTHEVMLDRQNQLLKEIAYIESHELRAPVSSIMGIMGIIKEDDFLASREYLELLDKAVLQLDEKIQKVVHYTGELKDIQNEGEPVNEL